MIVLGNLSRLIFQELRLLWNTVFTKRQWRFLVRRDFNFSGLGGFAGDSLVGCLANGVVSGLGTFINRRPRQQTKNANRGRDRET